MVLADRGIVWFVIFCFRCFLSHICFALALTNLTKCLLMIEWQFTKLWNSKQSQLPKPEFIVHSTLAAVWLQLPIQLNIQYFINFFPKKGKALFFIANCAVFDCQCRFTASTTAKNGPTKTSACPTRCFRALTCFLLCSTISRRSTIDALRIMCSECIDIADQVRNLPYFAPFRAEFALFCPISC